MFKARFLLQAVVLALFLGACTAGGTAPSPSTSTPAPSATPLSPTPTLPPTPIAVQDGSGQTVRLTHPATRIVSLAPSNTEILFAIGAGSQMVGRDEFSDYPTEAKSLPSISTSMGTLNTEALVALQPDLVLAAPILAPEQIQTLRNLGLTVFLVPNPTDFDGLYQNLANVGALTGRGDEAQALVSRSRQRVAAVEQVISKATSKPKVFYELDGSDPGKPWTAGPGNFIDLIIRVAGGQNAAAGLQEAYAQISVEELLSQNPDVIILGDTAYGITVASVEARPGWNVMNAIKNNAVDPFDDNLASRPGPRLIDGLEAMAKLVHPELFK
ncbi:MAG: cobalamin-binding protein [Anaerolineales bacterium]